MKSFVKHYMCGICNEEFRQLASLQVHMTSHVGQTSTQAQRKPTEAVVEVPSLTHNMETSPLPSNTANIANAISERHNRVVTDQLVKQDIVLYRCPQCDAVYNNKASIEMHVKMHKIVVVISKPTGNSTPSGNKVQHSIIERTDNSPIVIEPAGNTEIEAYSNRVQIGENHPSLITSAPAVMTAEMAATIGMIPSIEPPPASETALTVDFNIQNLDSGYRNSVNQIETDSHVCFQCGSEFSSSEVLAEHQQLHTYDQNNFTEVVTTPDVMSEEIITDETQDVIIVEEILTGNSKPIVIRPRGGPGSRYHCPICPKVFQLSCQLEVHMVKHNGGDDKTCPICHLQFNNLIIHIRSHSKERPYTCKYCPVTFKSSNSMEHHFKIKHTAIAAREAAKIRTTSNEGTENGQFWCPPCDVRFVTEWELMVHFTQHKGRDPMPCPDCGRKFTSLYQHMKYCGKGGNVGCPICKLMFRSPQALHHHVKKVHSFATSDTSSSNVHQFQIETSSQSTNSPRPRVLTNLPRGYRCEIWGARFVSRQVLRSHKTVHYSSLTTTSTPSLLSETANYTEIAPPIVSETRTSTGDLAFTIRPVAPLTTKPPCAILEALTSPALAANCTLTDAPYATTSTATETSNQWTMPVISNVTSLSNYTQTSTQIAIPQANMPYSMLDGTDLVKEISTENTPENRTYITQDPNKPLISGVENVILPSSDPLNVMNVAGPLPTGHRLLENMPYVKANSVPIGDNQIQMISTLKKPLTLENVKSFINRELEIANVTSLQNRPPTTDQETEHTEEEIVSKSRTEHTEEEIVSKGRTEHTEEHILRKRPPPCPICAQTFSKESALKEHLNYHTFGGYPCSLCTKVFKYKVSLDKHQKVHTGVSKFTCTACDAGFSYRSEMRRHSMMHTREKPFQCEMCKGTFREARKLERHMMKVHGIQKKVQRECIKCLACKKNLTTPLHLSEHMVTHIENPASRKLFQREVNKLMAVKPKPNHRPPISQGKKGQRRQRQSKKRFSNCSLCRYGFDTTDHLCTHLETVHGHSVQ